MALFVSNSVFVCCGEKRQLLWVSCIEVQYVAVACVFDPGNDLFSVRPGIAGNNDRIRGVFDVVDYCQRSRHHFLNFEGSDDFRAGESHEFDGFE